MAAGRVLRPLRRRNRRPEGRERAAAGRGHPTQDGHRHVSAPSLTGARRSLLVEYVAKPQVFSQLQREPPGHPTSAAQKQVHERRWTAGASGPSRTGAEGKGRRREARNAGRKGEKANLPRPEPEGDSGGPEPLVLSGLREGFRRGGRWATGRGSARMATVARRSGPRRRRRRASRRGRRPRRDAISSCARRGESRR